MKPFDLEKAMAGQPAITARGYSVQYLGTVNNFVTGIWHAWKGTMPGGSEILIITNNSGHAFLFDHYIQTPEHNIYMVPVKKSGYVNLYDWNDGMETGKVYDIKDDAIKNCNSIKSYITPIPIEWEE